MCTSIVEIVRITGSGRRESGWFHLDRAVVSYDHPHHAFLDEAVVIDFLNPAEGPSARAAVEIDLRSARALYEALGKVVGEAEAEEGLRLSRCAPPTARRPDTGRRRAR